MHDQLKQPAIRAQTVQDHDRDRPRALPPRLIPSTDSVLHHLVPLQCSTCAKETLLENPEHSSSHDVTLSRYGLWSASWVPLWLNEIEVDLVTTLQGCRDVRRIRAECGHITAADQRHRHPIYQYFRRTITVCPSHVGLRHLSTGRAESAPTANTSALLSCCRNIPMARSTGEGIAKTLVVQISMDRHPALFLFTRFVALQVSYCVHKAMMYIGVVLALKGRQFKLGTSRHDEQVLLQLADCSVSLYTPYATTETLG